MKTYEEYYTELMDSLFDRKKKKSISIGAIVFLILLIVNLYNFYMVVTTAGLGGLAFLSLGLPFAFITFVAVIFYIRKQHPQGIAKVISYTTLTVVTLMLVLFVIWVMYALLLPVIR
jgi:hypothetical protein